MVTTSRLLSILTLTVLLIGLTMAGDVGAAPFRPRPYSESSRLAAKTDCQLGGGHQFETVYHYQFGSSTPTSATTTCHGGTNDGETCEISGSNKQCTKPLTAGSSPIRSSSGGVIEFF